MLKNKFRELPSSDVNFEIISDSQAASLIGGCDYLRECGEFEGVCNDTLKKCGKFKESLQPISDR
jgi:hypothetical protein